MKKVLCLTLAVLSMLVTVACSRNQAAPAGEARNEPVTVKFWDMVGSEKYPLAAEALTKEITKTFPNINIQYQSIPWANNTQVFATAIAAGEGPDMSNGAGFASFDYYIMGELLDLKPIIDRWRQSGVLQNYDQTLINYFQVGGVQVGIPVGLEPRMFIYRKDWFDAAGLPEPKTWDDMYNAAKLFTDPAKGIYGMVYPCDAVAGNVIFYSWFGSNGSGIWTPDGSATDWTNPKNVEVIEFIRKLNNEKLFPEGMSAYQDAEVIQLASQDKVAMALFSSGNVGYQIASTNDGYNKWAVAPIPAGPQAAGRNGTSCAMNAFMAYKQSKHPEETLQALQWWCENVITLIKNKELGMGYVAPRKDWQADPMYLDSIGDPFMRDFVEKEYINDVHLLVWPAPNVSNWLVMNAINNQWGRVLSQEIITTNTPAGQLLEKRQKDSEALFVELAY
jgi:multiple sugar transport system substrate-binding protein